MAAASMEGTERSQGAETPLSDGWTRAKDQKGTGL